MSDREIEKELRKRWEKEARRNDFLQHSNDPKIYEHQLDDARLLIREYEDKLLWTRNNREIEL